MAWTSVNDRLPTHPYSVLGVVTSGPFVCKTNNLKDDRIRDVMTYFPDRKEWVQYVGEEFSPKTGEMVVEVSHWQEMENMPPAP